MASLEQTTVPPTADFGETLFGKPARYEGGLHQVGPGAWAWLQPNGELGESNAGLVVGNGAALLVDTLWDLKLTERMLDAMSRVSDAPIVTLFNTHSDGDHCWGNQLVADAEIVSTTVAAELMLELTPGMLRRTQRSAGLGRLIGSMPVPVVGSLRLPAVPHVPLKTMSSLLDPYDFGGIELTLPTRTFEGRLELIVGGRKVELIEVGPAHTQGDAIAWVPDAKVCFAADIMFVGGTPIMWAGPIGEWLAAIDTALALEADTYVPGHGPLATATELRRLREYFEWVRDEGAARVDRGASPGRAARELLLANDFESLPWSQWDDPARLVVTLSTERFKRAGGKGQLDGMARARAIVEMQRVAEEFERARA